MGAMNNLLIKMEEGRMDDATSEELELVKCMPKIMLAQAIDNCLSSGMSEEELDQAVLEAVQAYRINETNPVLLDGDFINRCKKWEKEHE